MLKNNPQFKNKKIVNLPTDTEIVTIICMQILKIQKILKLNK